MGWKDDFSSGEEEEEEEEWMDGDRKDEKTERKMQKEKLPLFSP